MVFIRHETRYQYPQTASQTIQRLILTPDQNKFQHVKNWKISLKGTRAVMKSFDHHGNLVHIVAQQERLVIF